MKIDDFIHLLRIIILLFPMMRWLKNNFVLFALLLCAALLASACDALQSAKIQSAAIKDALRFGTKAARLFITPE